MRILRLIVVVLFLITTAVFSMYFVNTKLTDDNTIPVIKIDDELIEVSFETTDEELLQGVTAYDEKDKDITDRVIVESVSRFVDEIPVTLIKNTGVAAQPPMFGGGMGGMRDSSVGGNPYATQFKKATAAPKPAPKPAEQPPVDLAVGDSVSHATFGTGVVLSAKPMGNDILLEIAFDKAGTKKLMAKFAKLKKI